MDNVPNISRKINNKSNSIYQIPATFKQISTDQKMHASKFP